ncbi:hypothetical protein L7F22_018558 [Adiantum nelumboides]|nr:hypothetical protein [Adiantum nelumboides]
MSMMGTFEQLAKNPRMQKLLKTKDYRTGSQAEISQQATSRQRQVTEPVERVPIVVIGPVQHVTQAQDPARNGHRSNEQSTHPTIPMHTSFSGYFGGGSVFQSMIRPSPGFQGYMPSTGNPMYDNIGVQPGFQIVPGSLGMAGTDLGMAGPSRPYVRPMDLSGGTCVSPNTDIPLLKPPVYDSLTPKGRQRTIRKQFDAAFTGGNFTEASKIRKAASFLKGNALQWWATLLNQGQVPSTWVQFKQIFAPAWLTSAFEVDVMTAWNQLSSVNCESLEEYNQMFWNAFLPVSSFKMVPLTEQVEKYCCGTRYQLIADWAENIVANADFAAISHRNRLKITLQVAMAMAAKAKLLLRELKEAKADLAAAKDRCVQLEEENRIIRASMNIGLKPDEEDLVRIQLETLLAEKARLAQENAYFARENQFLREMIEYHRLTMQSGGTVLDESMLKVTENSLDHNFDEADELPRETIISTFN